MATINVDGLPDGVVRSLQAFVNNLKAETTPAKSSPEAMEALKRAAGAWADADDAEFNAWLEATYNARKSDRPGVVE